MTERRRTPDARPVDVLHQLRERLHTNERDGLADMMAPDGAIEWPFRRGETPERIEGRDNIRDYLRNSPMAGLIYIEDLRPDAVYETSDPEVIVAETTTIGRMVATGVRFELHAIAILRIRGGKIVLYRDSINPFAAAEAVSGS